MPISTRRAKDRGKAPLPVSLGRIDAEPETLARRAPAGRAQREPGLDRFRPGRAGIAQHFVRVEMLRLGIVKLGPERWLRCGIRHERSPRGVQI